MSDIETIRAALDRQWLTTEYERDISRNIAAALTALTALKRRADRVECPRCHGSGVLAADAPGHDHCDLCKATGRIGAQQVAAMEERINALEAAVKEPGALQVRALDEEEEEWKEYRKDLQRQILEGR